jgi:hypothetical protein
MPRRTRVSALIVDPTCDDLLVSVLDNFLERLPSDVIVHWFTGLLPSSSADPLNLTLDGDDDDHAAAAGAACLRACAASSAHGAPHLAAALASRRLRVAARATCCFSHACPVGVGVKAATCADVTAPDTRVMFIVGRR